MNRHWRALIFLTVACCAFPERAPAPVVFKPGEKAKFQAPGEEEISGNAQELFNIAQAAEKERNTGRAIKAYRSLVRRYPKDKLAPDAAYRLAHLYEQDRDYVKAARAYAHLVEKYPQSPHFNESIDAQFRIGEMYLNSGKVKFLGIPIKNSLERAVEVFANVVRLAPFGKYTARAQFSIGLAREKQGLNDMAINAYQAVIDKFPDEPVGAAAQYQIGYIWFKAARQGTKDPNAAAQAKTAFQDFLFRYPKSEKVPQARENLSILDNKQTSDAFSVAKYYDKQKNYRAAVIYYNDVIRQQPGSSQGDQAKKRVDELRAKVGDAALQPRSLTDATAKKKAASKPRYIGDESSGPAMRTSPEDIAPLPPPESDISLPPPAELTPDPAFTPAPSPAPETTATPAASETSPAPGATASPVP